MGIITGGVVVTTASLVMVAAVSSWLGAALTKPVAPGAINTVSTLQAADGSVTIIMDAKQLTKAGAAALDPNAAGNAMQLSPGWVDEVIARIEKANSNSAAVAAIKAARLNGTLSTAVAGVTRGPDGRLLVLPVVVQNK